MKKETPSKSRICDCWLDVGMCYCEIHSSVRFSLRDKDGIPHGRYATLKEAMDIGRTKFQQFDIFDNIEEKILIEYGESKKD